MNMLRHGVKDTEFEIFHALLVGAVDLPMVSQLKSTLILPMDSRLMPRSRARGGRCSNPSLPGMPASASANSLPS
jgi:hypothetical protein